MSCDSRMRETCKVSEVLAGACLAGRLASALGALFGLNTHLSGPSRSVIVASPSPLVRRELSNTRMILKGGSVPQQGPAGEPIRLSGSFLYWTILFELMDSEMLQ